jgi:hypothetical protein
MKLCNEGMTNFDIINSEDLYNELDACRSQFKRSITYNEMKEFHVFTSVNTFKVLGKVKLKF